MTRAIARLVISIWPALARTITEIVNRRNEDALLALFDEDGVYKG